MAEREVIRCLACRLNQYMTTDERCRRCTGWLVARAPEPIAIEVIVPSERTPVVPWNKFTGDVDLGFAVRLIRLAQGLSQYELGQMVPCPRTYVSKIENRAVEPSIPSLLRFARAFDVPPFVLIAFACVPKNEATAA